MNLMTTTLVNELEILKNTPIEYELKDGEDFSEWKEKGRKKLAELLGLDKFLPCEYAFELEYKKEEESYTEYRFTFQSEKNYKVPCHLLVPKGVLNPPVMICLQGHGTGMHITMGRPKFEPDEAKIKNGDRDFATRALKEGYCALAIEQRNFGECGGNPKPTCHASSLLALLTGRTIIGARVHDISKAIDILEKEFSNVIDTKRIFCLGNSGGGTATLYAAALEDRIKGAIPSCAFCGFLESLGERNHCECNYVPQIRNFFDMAEIAGLIAPKPLVVVNGETDGIFPIESAKAEFKRLEKIYAAANARNKLVHAIGEEGHRFYADIAWEAFKSLL